MDFIETLYLFPFISYLKLVLSRKCIPNFIELMQLRAHMKCLWKLGAGIKRLCEEKQC